MMDEGLAQKAVDHDFDDDVLFLEEEETSARKTAQKAAPVKVVYSESDEPKKISVDDFCQHFVTRFKLIEKYLKSREDVQGLISISRLGKKQERETCSIIGMISEKSETKNKNIMMRVEDTTGEALVLVTPKNEEAYTLALELVLDDIISISGQTGKGIFFANQISLPGSPGKELRKSPAEGYAVFTGDSHVGSKAFLSEDFERFISWLSGEVGSPEQRRVAQKVKYLFIAGDLVDGIGIYPGQEEGLDILEIKEQYLAFAEYLKKVPERIAIIICPGNHDAQRISEPQLVLYKDFAAPLYALPNVTMVSNPSTVTIGEEGDFSGLDVLLYHGYSFIYYADNVPSLRDAGGLKRPDLILRYLLQRRHLAPTHGSNLYIPYTHKDPLVLAKIPDIIATGHIHRISVANYRGTTLLNTSCWTRQTEDQEKRGIVPQPGKVPVVNLQTREVKVMNFLKEDEDADEKWAGREQAGQAGLKSAEEERKVGGVRS